MKIKGKYYDNNLVALLSTILYNARWISLCGLVCNVLPTLEKATSSYGLDDETCFWGCCWVVITIGMFLYHKKLKTFYDVITDLVYSKVK